MEVRGRNGKWLGTRNRGVVQVVGVSVVGQFRPGVTQVGGGMNAFVVVDVIEYRAQMNHHEYVRGENRSRSGGRSIDREEGVDCRELAADFFFLNVEEVSDVLDHLFVGECQFVTGRTIRRRRGYDIGGVASTIGRRGQARWDEDRGGRARHCWNGWAVVWYV